jgi:predicted lipoprotein with Yx(FWY)xxD motif
MANLLNIEIAVNRLCSRGTAPTAERCLSHVRMAAVKALGRGLRGQAPWRTGVLLVGLGFVLTSCVGGSVSTLTSPPTTNPLFSLTIQHSPVGPILATGGGATLYDFVPDTPTHSACVNAGCVYQWPPLLVSDASQVGPGVTRSFVGTLKRPDGATQLSYNGHPLYLHIRDAKAGEVMGQDIDQDGGLWYVLSPSGKEIHTPFSVSG